MHFLIEHWKEYVDGLLALFLVLNRLDLVRLRRSTNAAFDVLTSLKSFSDIVAGKDEQSNEGALPKELQQ